MPGPSRGGPANVVLDVVRNGRTWEVRCDGRVMSWAESRTCALREAAAIAAANETATISIRVGGPAGA